YRRLDDPDRHYIRKLYGVGGTDAHGDFNFSHYNLASAVSGEVLHYYYDLQFHAPATYAYDNAWAKVRTYALGTSATPSSALDGMMHGRAVVTDGPLIIIDVDADPRLSSATLDFDINRVSFDDPSPAAPFFDADGQMRGDGPMEGARTALVMMPSVVNDPFLTREIPIPRPSVRFRVVNTFNYGAGNFGVTEV